MHTYLHMLLFLNISFVGEEAVLEVVVGGLLAGPAPAPALGLLSCLLISLLSSSVFIIIIIVIIISGSSIMC